MKTFAAFGSLLVFVVACGKGAPEAAAPQAPAAEAAPSSLAGSAAEPEPQTLAEAEALLDKARADLDRLALNEPGSPAGASGAVAPSPAPAPPATRAESRSEEKNADKAAADQAPAKKEANACDTACKAFSSLERASDAVCRLDTEAGGKRCERAKQIREDAARRVSSCSCR